MFAHFRNVLRKATQDVIIAQMHKDGVHNAFEMNKEKGRYIYDETKDPRFYVYDPKLAEKGIGKNEPPKEGTEDWNKWIKWKASRKELIREGGITKEGKMRRPYSTKELTSMKQYAIKLFGALDNSEALIADTSATWRMMTTFKKWVLHRVHHFYQAKDTTWANAKWKEVRDENGMIIDYEYVKGDFEGLVQSVFGILSDIKDMGWSEAVSGASDVRKENLGKLVGDLILALLLYGLFVWLKDQDWGNDQLLKELQRGTRNALGDVIVPYSVYYAVTSNAMPSVGMVGNLVKSGWTGIHYGITGDFDKALSAADQIGNLNGVYRLGKVFEIDDLITNE
jgi:hypothetical protein